MGVEINDSIIPDIGYLIYRKCTPTWEIAENEISFYDLTYVVEGRGVYIINGVPYEVKKGDVLCIPKGSIRKAYCFAEDLMHLYSANFKLYDLNGQPASGLPLPLLSHIGIKNDLIELILLNKDSISMDYRVTKVMNYISENYASHITVQELADLVGLNHVYFGALFKKETGMLIKQYLAQTRINHAQDMLQNGECNVSEAAERCGYRDLTHFRKQFKKIKGYPPSHCLRKP